VTANHRGLGHIMKGCDMRNSTPAAGGHYLDEYDGPRFWQHVEISGGEAHRGDPLATADGQCWTWNGQHNSGSYNYGRFRLFGNWASAHRVAYKDFGNRLDDDLELDHLCRNPPCVNPWHLEPVTRTENVRRGIAANKTHCPKGHEYTPENTSQVKRKGKPVRYCGICLRESRHRTYLNRKAAGKV